MIYCRVAETRTRKLNRSLIFSLAVVVGAALLTACSLPNLEEQDCTQARDVIREFYSFHIAHDMKPTEENVRAREKFLTPNFSSKLIEASRNAPFPTDDFFTHTADFPKAFRAAECKVLEPGKKVEFRVLLFWKDDTRSEQRSVNAIATKVNDDWLIDEVGRQE